MTGLQGKRILLVEDEFFVAAMAADMLAELGATVVGPAATIAKGMRLAETEALDAAVLDLNIGGERSDAIAAALRARNVSVVFATGYGRAGLAMAGTAAVVEKPYSQEKLAEALLQALSASA